MSLCHAVLSFVYDYLNVWRKGDENFNEQSILIPASISISAFDLTLKRYPLHWTDLVEFLKYEEFTFTLHRTVKLKHTEHINCS